MPYNSNTDWANEANYLNGLISSGDAGQQAWARNQLGVLNSAKSQYAPVNLDPSIGSYTNALDVLSGVSEHSSARSLQFAQQHQDWSASQAAIANNYNALEAAKSRNWQEYMSNTAHQREVADLRAAGLNPVLSASGGNGAAVTSGAAASAAMPTGSAGQSDNSTNGALVQILGSMLSAQTAIANQAVSARTQEAVADKYTEMSRLTAQIAAGAAMYGADTQYRINADFPTSLVRIIDSMMSGAGTTWSDIGGKVSDYVGDYMINHPSLYKDAKDAASSLKDKVFDAVDRIKQAITGKSKYSDGDRLGSGRGF